MSSQSLEKPGRWRLAFGATLLILGITSLIVSSLYFDVDAWLNRLQQHRHAWQTEVRQHPYLSSLIFFIIYVLFAGLALPGAMVLTLAGGAVFGWLWGVMLVSFASTTGATLAMLLSRTLLRDWVQRRYAHRLPRLQAELERAGGWYLLSLRLNPAVPFFLINVAFGLTQMSVRRFWWISQLGMLPATLIYVWAGGELDRVLETGQLLQPRLIAALFAVSLLPLLLRWLTKRWQAPTSPQS
ncbi:TVP38/TMEM64 family inner membrane protein YdjZ [bacterium HR36]|nr:TVP38/TMEM64 family inner membrane protein YdjZ [bacterium HR36]